MHSRLLWTGAAEPFLGQPSTIRVGHMVLGRNGGPGGRNEDAAYLRPGQDWEYAVVADGHGGSDSSALAVGTLADVTDPASIVPALLAADTSNLTGETAVLTVVRRGSFLHWLSIGDCGAYALHPELAALGQYALNQRSFYEWFGRVDSLRLDVPCYSSGVHALRPGRTRIVLLTDGALDAFDPAAFYDGDVADRVGEVMRAVTDDSATVVAWDVVAGATIMWPSA